MALSRTSNSNIFHKIFLHITIAYFCVIAGSQFCIGTTIFVQAASAESSSSLSSLSLSSPTKLNKLFKGMSPGMQQKMSFLALTTSKIDHYVASEEQKAAIRKQFQRTFQKGAASVSTTTTTTTTTASA